MIAFFRQVRRLIGAVAGDVEAAGLSAILRPRP